MPRLPHNSQKTVTFSPSAITLTPCSLYLFFVRAVKAGPGGGAAERCKREHDALVCGIDRADNLVSDGAAVLELVAELSEGGLEIHLGDGNTFADHAGCGVVVIDKVDPETREGQSVVLTSAALETLRAFGGASVDLREGTTGHYMGCGIYVVDQVPADGSGAQRIVLTLEDLETLLA